MAITLEKGQRISLEKGNGSKLTNICVGVNWGAIVIKKGLFGRTENSTHQITLLIRYGMDT